MAQRNQALDTHSTCQLDTFIVGLYLHIRFVDNKKIENITHLII